MSKYGNGVSIKDVIINEVTETEKLLKNSDLPEEEQVEIINSLKEMAYQWCKANALSCALEDIVKNIRKELNGNEESDDLTWAIIIGKITDQKMKETYPFMD